MRQYSSDLFDYCKNEFRNAIQNFCHNINKSSADILVIMAHKAVLLYYVLLEQGYINKDVAKKITVTNFALDFDSSYLKGKRIAILDDIVISGTSIASAVQRLMAYGVAQENIEVIAVAIDKDYFVMKFTDKNNTNVLHCDFYFDDAACIELSSVISKVFSCYGVPYDVDFPVYNVNEISSEQIANLYDSVAWKTIDVSNDNQKSNHVTAFTVFPQQVTESYLWEKLGMDLQECVDIKIRVYMTHYPDDTIEASVVPMCLFKEIGVSELKRIYDIIRPNNQHFFFNRTEEPIALLRYIGFYLSQKIFEIFSETTCIGENSILEKRNVVQLFGLIDGETIYNQLKQSNEQSNELTMMRVKGCSCDYTSIINEYNKSKVYKQSCKESIGWNDNDPHSKSYWINYFNYVPFLWWYDTKEIIVRNKIKNTVPNYVDDFGNVAKCLFRLSDGLPVSLLGRLLHQRVPELSNSEVYLTVSTFLDRAIDEGIIVPTIYYNGNNSVICRAYRHGEDLPFGVSDQYRLVLFLQAFSEKIESLEENSSDKTPKVGAISLEKIIVLFYQIGLRKGNVFNRFLEFDNTSIIHAFLSIHGAVQGFTDHDANPHVFSERNEKGEEYITWLTLWLCNQGLLIPIQDPNQSDQLSHYEIDDSEIENYLFNNNRSATSEEIQNEIRSIAQMISMWFLGMVNLNKRINFRDDVTALTSCANSFVYASAIATENHYFKQYFDNQIRYAAEEQRSYKKFLQRLTNSATNRDYTRKIEQGLFSGQKKIEWRKLKRAQNVIKIAQTFMDDTNACVWNNIWSGSDSIPDYRATEFQEHTHMAESMLYFFSAYFICAKSDSFWQNTILPDECNNLKALYYSSKLETGLMDDDLFAQLESIAAIGGANNFAEKKNAFFDLGRYCVQCSERCVKNIEMLVQVNDPAYTVKYTSALVIDVDVIQPLVIEKKVMEVWKELKEDRTKTKINIIRFPNDLQKGGARKYGVFIAENGTTPLDTQYGFNGISVEQRGNLLYELFNKICTALNAQMINIRGILLPHIVPINAFRHNLQRNIDENARVFYKNMVCHFEHFYNCGYKKQLILGLDRQVPNIFLNTFQEKQWQTSKVITPSTEEVGGYTCYQCYKNYCKPRNENDDLMSRVTYSHVRIRGVKETGLGLLVRLQDRVVCISCNHIFLGCSSENLSTATSSFDSNVSFELRPYTEIQLYDKTGTLLAENELLVLEPLWNGDIPLDVSKLVSFDDWGEEKRNRRCKCYAQNADGQMAWVDCGRVQGLVENGYYQIDSVEFKIEKGCSGGVYISIENNKIVGVHQGRFDGLTKARVIPWMVVVNAFHNLIGDV